MKVKEVTISRGAKVSVNYSSFEAHVSATAEVSSDEEIKELSNFVDDFFQQEMDRQADVFKENKTMWR